MIGHHRGIAITENVYKHIQEKHKTRRLPDFEVKWRDQPLKRVGQVLTGYAMSTKKRNQ
jgi:hypothetical protein